MRLFDIGVDFARVDLVFFCVGSVSLWIRLLRISTRISKSSI